MIKPLMRWKSRGSILQLYVAFAAVGFLATALTSISVQAAQIAHEDFDYGGGVSFSTNTANGGTGWVSPWMQTGVASFVTSGSGMSLDFNQLPGLVTDGSTHIWTESSKGNYRSIPDVSMGSDTFYLTALVRDYGGGASIADMRIQLHDTPNASGGNMRGNFGIDGGTLFADGNTTGYGVGDTLSGAFATNTTYLLAVKRDSAGISAALIFADGLASTLASEPVWQVTDAVATGVTFKSIRVLTNSATPNTGAGIRIDEMRVATDWAGAVDGLIVVPEPSSLLLAGLGVLAMIGRRRRS